MVAMAQMLAWTRAAWRSPGRRRQVGGERTIHGIDDVSLAECPGRGSCSRLRPFLFDDEIRL